MIRHPTTLVIATALAAIAATAVAAHPDDQAAPPPRAAPAPPSATQIADAKRAFGDVAKVLLSPRCRNCHPRGDVPLQTDAGLPHRLNISRASEAAGMACATCHQERNSEALGIVGGPPGAHHWAMPPKHTPMRFQGHTPASLCEQLKDPKRNGKRSLSDLLHHVQRDPLVLWAWNPGGSRTKPPLSHKRFVAAVATWVAGDGACPDPEPTSDKQ